jgi:hypothetical protein
LSSPSVVLAFFISSTRLRRTLVLDPFLERMTYPPFSHHELGRDFAGTNSASKKSRFAASLISSSRGVGIANPFATFLPSARDFTKSRFAGQTMSRPEIFNFFYRSEAQKTGNYFSPPWIRTAFTTPCWPGLDVTMACPSGVSRTAPFVMTPRRW